MISCPEINSLQLMFSMFPTVQQQEKLSFGSSVNDTVRSSQPRYFDYCDLRVMHRVYITVGLPLV